MSWNILTTEDCDSGAAGHHNSERYVEIALAQRWLDTLSDDQELVEIGAVLPYHIECNHTIIDPYDEKATIMDFMENYNYQDKSVLSISTVEHIGNLEYGNTEANVDPKGAINALIKILDESNKCLVTLPCGWNPYLDEWIKDNLHRLECFGYDRGPARDMSVWPPTPLGPNWKYVETVEDWNYPYAFSSFTATFIICITGWKI